MSRTTLIVDPSDDMVVALVDHEAGATLQCGDRQIVLTEAVPAKHKFARRDFATGQLLRMYGITVGRATREIQAGQRITVGNLTHATDAATAAKSRTIAWQAPDISAWKDKQFAGYHRADGRVGAANYWIVLPLVFCENRNLRILREALVDKLGYGVADPYRTMTQRLIESWRSGASPDVIRETALDIAPTSAQQERPFPNVDGIKFLSHEGGCGGLYEDAKNLCGLLAGYINHPNVAGATVLSLGCQKSQIRTLEQELHQRNPEFKKPLYIFEQQQMASEQTLIETALRHTFAGVAATNELTRKPAALEQLTLGVECGGSDGFSGLSANPAIGHCSDLLIACGGSVILSEFPELAGCEQELVDRCVSSQTADRFLQIMRDYEARATADGGGFDSNPSPGNIADGLITDAIKSAGAAKKGGTSPVQDVLDYPEPKSRSGLSLLCTPGGDVESTTAMAGSGATVQLFSTGLGTPTGNPVSPVLKLSTNTDLATRLPDIIDLDAGPIITGAETIPEVGERILDLVIETASGRYQTKAQRLGQDDFIPWRRGISF